MEGPMLYLSAQHLNDNLKLHCTIMNSCYQTER